MPVVTSKDKQRVVIHNSGHAASIRKMRCPQCKLGYAVQDNVDKTKYVCQRCGASLKVGNL